MARISTYIKDTNLSLSDKVIGTDFDNSNATVNFPLGSIAEFVKDTIGISFTFIQATASTTWNITHTLNRFPSVTIVDSSGNVIISDTLYNNENQITLNFTAPFSGKAYLN